MLLWTKILLVHRQISPCQEGRQGQSWDTLSSQGDNTHVSTHLPCTRLRARQRDPAVNRTSPYHTEHVISQEDRQNRKKTFTTCYNSRELAEPWSIRQMGRNFRVGVQCLQSCHLKGVWVDTKESDKQKPGREGFLRAGDPLWGRGWCGR